MEMPPIPKKFKRIPYNYGILDALGERARPPESKIAGLGSGNISVDPNMSGSTTIPTGEGPSLQAPDMSGAYNSFLDRIIPPGSRMYEFGQNYVQPTMDTISGGLDIKKSIMDPGARAINRGMDYLLDPSKPPLIEPTISSGAPDTIPTDPPRVEQPPVSNVSPNIMISGGTGKPSSMSYSTPKLNPSDLSGTPTVGGSDVSPVVSGKTTVDPSTAVGVPYLDRLTESMDFGGDYLNALAAIESPRRGDFDQSTWQKVLTSLAGGLTGMAEGPSRAMGMVRSIQDYPYEEAYRNYLDKIEKLKLSAGLSGEQFGRLANIVGLDQRQQGLNTQTEDVRNRGGYYDKLVERGDRAEKRREEEFDIGLKESEKDRQLRRDIASMPGRESTPRPVSVDQAFKAAQMALRRQAPDLYDEEKGEVDPGQGLFTTASYHYNKYAEAREKLAADLAAQGLTQDQVLAQIASWDAKYGFAGE